jgi:hypothetical protein
VAPRIEVRALNAVLDELIYASVELFWGMITESRAADLTLDVDQLLLFRFMSFHVLIYTGIVLLLAVSEESATAYLALAKPYLFLFRSPSFGIKPNGRCRELGKVIIEFFLGMLAKQTVADLARALSDFLPYSRPFSGNVLVL